PASGKTTLTRLLCQKLDLIEVNKYTILRFMAPTDNIKYSGDPIPANLLLEMFEDMVELPMCQKRGWLLDAGILNTRECMVKMQQDGVHPTHCIFLEAPENVLVERAAGKRIDKRNEDIYHITFDWPINPSVKPYLAEVPGCSEQEIVRQYVKYQHKLPGLIDRFKKNYKKINADQPKADILSSALAFLSTKSHSMAPHTPRVLLLGAIGSGRRTQAHLLSKRFHLVNVPNSVVSRIVQERLTQVDCVTCGWVLHGFPRNLQQCNQLDVKGLMPTRVFFLDVSQDSILERLTPLRTDLVTGKQHHLHFNPPQTLSTTGHLRLNPKHTREHVLEKISQFQQVEDNLFRYLEQQSVHLNADQDYYTVFETIISMIINPLTTDLPLN
ncbi:adenylate kinase 8-like, partial [Argonauta hians]